MSRSSSTSVGPKPRGIIFDMDGTLLNTRKLIAHCVKEVVEKYLGRTFTTEEIMANFGPAAREIVSKYTTSLGQARKRNAIEDYYKCYHRELPSRATLFPGIEELLKDLQESGRRLGLFTGVERVQMDITLDAFGLRRYFQAFVARDDVECSKPDPEGVNLALSKLGLRPEEALIVGDSPADILAGKRAGVATAAAIWSGEHTTGDPCQEGPTYSFRSVRELREFLI